jgi:CBS-domain-containing membrane protein
MVYVCRPPLERRPASSSASHTSSACCASRRPCWSAPVIANDIETLRPESSLEHVHRLMAAYNLVASPVVDEATHLVGVVTVDDVLDHLLPAGWREGGGLRDG